MACACSSIKVSEVRARARASSAASRNLFSILWPKASSPISPASKCTSGARSRRPVSSMMRMTRNGAASSRQRCQTPSASSAVTDVASNAVVRLSGAPAGQATSAVSTPALANAIAAMSPTGPPPTTTTSTDLPLMQCCSFNAAHSAPSMARSLGRRLDHAIASPAAPHPFIDTSARPNRICPTGPRSLERARQEVEPRY